MEQDVKTPQPEEADHGQTTKNEGTIIQPSPQSGAAAELRVHELLALLACFVFPIIGAWLLHHIRAQLSRPSEGLVSNYNLTIFLLASELRPLSHLVKMIQVRTLYLQRTVAAEHPEEGPKIDLVDISSRLDELEAHVADSSAAAAAAANSPNSSVVQQQQITAEVRKSLQPDLDALNRAVRRYEKKATILSMQVESRLQDLEARMSDAITLAAAAERNISKSNLKRGSYVLVLLDWLSRGLLLPVQVVWAVVSLPASLACSMWGIMEGYVGNKIRREMKTAGRTGASGGHGRKGAAGGRGAKKTI